MDSALDVATDTPVLADDASVKRRYACGTCHAPVTIKGGFGKQRRHFAHVAGEADPDCEEYYPSNVSFRGRRFVPERALEPHEAWDREDLLFDVTPTGASLYLWIPSTAGTGAWSGTVDVEAHRVARRLTAQHLQRGQIVGFPLAEGRWRISLSGEISPDYTSRITIGPGSIESHRNLFDAVHSPGRRLGPTQRLRLGDAVWVITRDANFPQHAAARFATCEARPSAGGWRVFYVELPDSANSEEVYQLADWLERRIRPPRVRVWIERPWPSAYTRQGLPILHSSASEVEIRAEEPVDLKICQITGRVAAGAEQVRRLVWPKPEIGAWQIQVNGQIFVGFEIADRIQEPTPALSAALDSSAPLDLFQAQDLLTRQVQRGLPPKSIVLRWSHPSIRDLICSGEPASRAGVPESEDHLVLRPPTINLSAENLGNLRWPKILEASRSSDLNRIRDLYPTARWLISVALPLGSSSGASLSVPRRLLADPIVGPLARRRWPLMLYPQLANLRARLEKSS